MSSYLAETPIAICPRCSRDGDYTVTTHGLWHTCPACGGDWKRSAADDDTAPTTRLGNMTRRMRAFFATPRGTAALNAAGGLAVQLVLIAAVWFGVYAANTPVYYGLITLFGVGAVNYGTELIQALRSPRPRQ